EKVGQHSRHLEEITEAITQGMNDMAQGANQIVGTVTRVIEISSENKTGINALFTAVSKFKVEASTKNVNNRSIFKKTPEYDAVKQGEKM
ncbi:hypothetical protein ACYULU_14960, partial [Breznakiellaceae bacterium SP9]